MQKEQDSTAFDVVGLGLSSLDYFCIVPDLPSFDTMVEATACSVQGGGIVAQALVTLARLGARTAFIGACGDDFAGEEQRAELTREGVNIERFAVLPGRASTQCPILIQQHTGKRAITLFRGAADDIDPATLDLELIKRARILHMDGFSPDAALVAAQAARSAGVIVSLDAEPRDAQREALVRLSDLVIVGEPEARRATRTDDAEQAARAIAAMGPRTVVITRGEHGTLALNENEVITMPAFSVPVVDTTGAGDTFHGGYLYALLQGWDIRRTIEFASATAALKCRAIGGRIGIPRLHEVEEFLATRRAEQAD